MSKVIPSVTVRSCNDCHSQQTLISATSKNAHAKNVGLLSLPCILSNKRQQAAAGPVGFE